MRRNALKPNEIGVGWSGRLYPGTETSIRSNRWLGASRFLWNKLLGNDLAVRAATGKLPTSKQRRTLMLAIKREHEWLLDLPAHYCIDTEQRLTSAWSRMFKMAGRAKAERWSKEKRRRMCGRPQFKKKFKREAGIYCVGQGTTIGDGFVIAPKLGRIALSGGDVPAGRLLSARIMRDGVRWMFSAQFAVKRPLPMEPTGRMTGSDLGVSTLITTFDGEHFEETPAPRRLRKSLKRLRRVQRMVSRRQKGSNRRRDAVKRLANLHRKVRQQRREVLHQISHRLTAKADVIKVETLNVAGMLANRHLALSVADAGMGNLLRMLDYKADWRGRTVVKTNMWFPSSQLCSNPDCGALNPHMKDLRERTFVCQACGYTEGRDRNASRNIYGHGEEPRAGLMRCGAGVSHRATGAVRVETRSLVASSASADEKQ